MQQHPGVNRGDLDPRQPRRLRREQIARYREPQPTMGQIGLLAAGAQVDAARRTGRIDRHRERAAPGSPCILPDGIQRGARDQYVDIWAALHRTECFRPTEHGRDAVASVVAVSGAAHTQQSAEDLPLAAGQRTQAFGHPPDLLPIVTAQRMGWSFARATSRPAARLSWSGYVDAGPTMPVGTCLGLVTIACICFGIGVDGANPSHFAGVATPGSACRIAGIASPHTYVLTCMPQD